MNDSIILVNDKDEEIGYGEKMEVHRMGQLHRAFSLFIVDETQGTILIQKRDTGKYHSGGLWTNACCSHPRKNETLWDAVYRRTEDELGILIPNQDRQSNYLWESKKFIYKKDFGGCIEYEIDHVFIWSVDSSLLKINPNNSEIDDYMWIEILDLDDWIVQKPEDFTAWFFPAYEIFLLDVLTNPTMMCSPISSELDKVIQKKKKEILIAHTSIITSI